MRTRMQWTTAALAAFGALLLAACASTRLDGTWMRPEFAGTRLSGPVLVVGVARDDTVRRVYEDAMVAQLAARGIDARRSYELAPAALQGDSEELLQQAARKAGAAWLLSTAVIGQSREAVVTQDPSLYMGWGWRGWYRAYWGLSYPLRTEVRTYSVYTAQTVLTDVARDRIEWTARTRTTDPADVERETRGFVQVIVGAMEKAGLVAPASR